MTAWGRGCKAYRGRHVASATPPIRAPAFDGHVKAAPDTGPDHEPRRRPKYVHLCIASSCVLFLARVFARIVGPNGVRPGASAAGPYTRRGTGILPVMFMARMAMPRGWRIHCSGCMRQRIPRGTVAQTLGNPGTSRRGRRHKEQCRRHPPRNRECPAGQAQATAEASAGISSQVRPASSRPAFFFLVPPSARRSNACTRG